VVGLSLGSEPPFGLSFSALGAAVLCLANFALATFVLRESLPPEKRGSKPSVRRRRLQELLHHTRRPVAGPLMVVFFLSGLAMAQMESMLFPYMADIFGWGLKTSSYGFAYIGVLMVITQGWLIRKWMPRFGEGPLLVWGLALFAISLFGIPLFENLWFMAVMMTLLALGNGLMRPPNLGLISLVTPPEEQGMVMGVTNSLASLGRIIGPILGGLLYEKSSKGAPFIFAGGLAVIALLMVIYGYRRLPETGRLAQAHDSASDGEKANV
jgi:predicted MFS family arabinose efflux permease